MSKKVNRVGKLFLRFIATASLLSAPSLASAQCVVGGTNFDVATSLFDPKLSDDEDGWLNEDVADLLAEECGKSCDYYEAVFKGKQLGLSSNTMNAAGGLPATSATEKVYNPATSKQQVSVITANPKLISSYFKNMEGQNMMVNIGFPHSVPVYTYSLGGLEPGSTITFTCDVYNLLDPSVFAYLYTELGVEQNDLKYGNYSYNPSQKGFNGNAMKVGIGNSLKPNGEVDYNMAMSKEVPFGGSTKLTLTAKVDDYGSATFYICRGSDCPTLPLGIDNVEITGSIKPVISYSGNPCAKMVATVKLKQSYPEGTTYSWSETKTGTKGSEQVFKFVPQEKKTDYTVGVTVTLPGGCKAAAADPVTITTGDCCTDANGNPMAITNIVYDNFGEFTSPTTYEYTDEKFVTHTVNIPNSQLMYTEDKGNVPFVKAYLGSDAIKLDPIPATGGTGIWSGQYAVSNVNPYSKGVQKDYSGTGTGGMLLLDLGTVCTDVLYERKIEGLCEGKKITFGTAFAAINKRPGGGPVGKLSVQLIKEGQKTPFYEVTKELTGDEGWQWASDNFEMDEDVNSVTLRVVNLTVPCGGDGVADYAIDDITFQVCTPPDVDVSSSLTAEQLLDLCTDNPLTLSADITEDAKKFYGDDIAYLFQYTYQDPTVVDDEDIIWYDLTPDGGSSAFLNKGEFTIDKPANHAAFSKLADGEELNVYFRVVIGEKTYLQSKRSLWEHMSATSPCRAVSISSIPIVAALNCAACTEPNDIEFVDGDKKTVKSVKLCKGESVTLTTNDLVPADPEKIMSDDFKGFLIEWFKDGDKVAALSDKPLSKAMPNEITYGATDAAGKTTWMVRATDPDFPESAKCIKEAEIVVEFLPQPEIEDVPLEYCYGAPEADDVLPTAKAGEVIKYYETEAAALDGTTDVPAPALATLEAKDEPYEYYYTLTNADGCVSLPAKVIITVNAIPEYVVDPIDPFCAKQSEIDALPVADEDAKYTIAWTPAAQAAGLNSLEGSTTPYALTYIVTDAATGCAAEPQNYTVTVMPATTVKLTADSICGKTTVTATPTPTTATLTYFADDVEAAEKAIFLPGDDVKEWKVVADADGFCPSADSIAVTIQKVPGIVTTADPSCYLKSQEATFADVQKHCAANGVVAALFDETDANNKGAGLEWRIAGTTDWSSTIPTPTVKNPKDPAEETIDYEVRLKNAATGCFGETAEFTAHIYGAPVPNVTNAEYCQNATADPLSSRVTINNTIAGTYTLKVYTDKGKTSPVDMETAPSTATPGVVTYYATQTGVGGESDPVAFTVTTYGVDIPTVAKTDFMLCRDRDLAELSAELNVNPAKYMMGTTLLWSEERGDFKEEKPVVSNAKAGEFMYSVKQVYNIITEGFVATCEGEAVSIHVTVDETDAPTGTMSVLYLYNDLETKGSFDNLLDQDATVVTIEDGYKYEYAVADAAGNVTGAWSTTVPTPAAVDRSELVDEPKVVYYKVRRTKTTGGQCPSEEKLITVTITDSPTPAVTPAYFCEGETIPSLDAYAKTTGTTKIPATGYTLLWYGSEKPAATDMESGKETAPASQVASVDATGKTTTYTYYVAQRENASKAIGSPIALNITVYPKPIQTIATLPNVCETNVDISKAVSFVKEASGASYVTKYYSDAAGTAEIPAAVAESGTYYAQTSFATPNASLDPSVCASTVDPIEVTIETLDLTPVVDAETCPNTAGLLHAEITTNVANASFLWKAKVGSDAKIDVTSAGSSDFTTTELLGNAGDKFLYDLAVTAGSCSESQTGIVVTLGDGPVVGTLTLDESDNANTGKVYTSTRDVTADPFYMCGAGVTATAALEKDADSEFTWTNAAGSTVGTGASATINAPGVYTISYSNHCATSMTFEVKDASIKGNAAVLASGALNKAAEGETLVICEKEPMEMTLAYTAGNDASTVAWTKDGAATTIVSGKSTSIAKSTPEQSGVYEYTITNYGCTATGSVEAKVKPYIQFAPEAIQYVARRDSQLNIQTVISIPAAGTPSNISWTNKAGTEVNTTKDFLYTVSATDKFTITMSDDDYCDATATVEVIKDARIQFESTLDEKMCRGDKGVYLVIDTTGTGKYYYPNKAMVVVTETIGEASHVILNGKAESVNYKIEVNPTADATYTTTITYREGEGVDEQKVVHESSIIVLQPIQIKVPTGLSVCAGDELEISLLSVTPEGSVVVNWQDDASITSGNTDTETITVVPEYDEETGRNHNSSKVYYLTATMEGCAEKKEKVTITVNEPITGSLSDTTICEGTSVRLDAGNFKAAKYVWTTPLIGNPIGSSQTTLVTPEVTTTYNVAMTRGNCKAEAEMTVNVNSNPVIVQVDSLDYRKVSITLDESYGTAPYMYTVDDTSKYDVSNEVDKLSYSVHVAMVKDAVGCKAVMPFTVKRPLIVIPAWFSPNGDDQYDFWKPKAIQETYPEAVIKIFDRWGKVLATFRGDEEGWDGFYNGKPMPSTDYWYEVTIHEIDKVFTGHFTLIRR